MNNPTTPQEVHSLDTSSFIATPKESSAKNIFKSFLKSFSNQKFNGVTVPLAFESYLLSKYDKLSNNEERMDDFMATIASRINTAHSNNIFSTTIVIPEDIIEFKNVIIKFFQDKGYVVADLHDFIPSLVQNYLFICWDNFALCQDSLNLNSIGNSDTEE